MLEICVLDTSKYPEDIPLNFDRSQIKSLCHRFYMMQAINATTIALENFLDNDGKKSVSADLELLLNCIKVIPCSPAQCEKSFRAMNNILTRDVESKAVEALLFLWKRKRKRENSTASAST